jgi:hypothetical protein
MALSAQLLSQLDADIDWLRHHIERMASGDFEMDDLAAYVDRQREALARLVRLREGSV